MIKKSNDFNEIINNGKCLKNKYFSIYYNDNETHRKFGLAVSKKMGCAVVRNKIKRQLRMIIDNNKNVFPNKRNYIIMVRKGILNISYQEMNESLINLLLRKDNR